MPRSSFVAKPEMVPTPAVDGRNARRERGRQAVIDAVVDLLHEGHAPPSTVDVTERAGVSEATLFRYFDTIDDLQLVATERFLSTHARLFDIPQEGTGSLDARVERFATARAALWEVVAPVARLGRVRAFDHPGMAILLRDARRKQALQVERHFAPELHLLTPAQRADLVAVLAALTSFEAWDIQRHDLDRTTTQVRRAWRTAIAAQFTRPTEDPPQPTTRSTDDQDPR